jgi:AcrR family transcriptional regulator
LDMETKRKYNSESRRAQALVTRRIILEAAKRLFASKGFDKTTIDGIASAAGLSTPTVYALFKSKGGILEELINETVLNERYRSLVGQSASSPDPRQALKVAARIARTVHDAQESELGPILGTSVISPELRALEREGQRVRYERQQFIILALEKENLLADTLSLSHARDILWSLTSREMYRMLVVEKGWSSDEYETWLGRTLLQTLVATPLPATEETTGTTLRRVDSSEWRRRKDARVVKDRSTKKGGDGEN